MIRQLAAFVVSLRPTPRCPYGCGERVPVPAINHHWRIDHAGEKGIHP